MSTKLTLRLQDADLRAFSVAAAIIAGTTGTATVGRTAIIRRALAEFNAQHAPQAQRESRS